MASSPTTTAQAPNIPMPLIDLSDDEVSSSPSPSASPEEKKHFARNVLGDEGRVDARAIVRLMQCPVCTRILQNPVALPCGSSVCARCLPPIRLRPQPRSSEPVARWHGFDCPLPDCYREHLSADCGFDVSLRKFLGVANGAIESTWLATGPGEYVTRIAARDVIHIGAATGVPSLQKEEEQEPDSLIVRGGRILATYAMAERGGLDFDTEVSYSAVGTSEEEIARRDEALFLKIKGSTRSDMDCQVCYGLLLDPVSTVCGHTFCRGCLLGSLDQSDNCPVCRALITPAYQPNPRSTPTNKAIASITNQFWPDEVAERAEEDKEDQKVDCGGFDCPIFVCGASLPSVGSFLHIFEPRYRLMMERALETNRRFGVVLKRANPGPGEPEFMEMGVLMRIVRHEPLANGRLLVELFGISRFRITRHGVLDGYVVADIEDVVDISPADEEAIEVFEAIEAFQANPRLFEFRRLLGISAAETAAETGSSTATTTRPRIYSPDDLNSASTREMLEFGVRFVQNVQRQSAKWFNDSTLLAYGECPCDPATFPWWFASIMPLREEQRYNLLGTLSLRGRMKMCCQWMLELKARSRRCTRLAVSIISTAS